MRWLGVLVLAVALAGCGDSGGGDAQADVEGVIASQLPASTMNVYGQVITVDNVTCVSTGDLTFDCIAKVTTPNGPQDVSISASCDDVNCVWREEK